MSTSTSQLADAEARARALDIGISCIVQAPAGSGKTELLTLRYLKLLSVSAEPEAVLAITFTRKAASEMRNRILNTLQWALDTESRQSSLSKEFERLRFDIARRVIARDKELGWKLLENPNRLRVQTIDSFCFYLANQLPVLSRIGGSPSLSEDTEHIYSHAVSNTLKHLNSNKPLSNDICELLAHFDNNVAKLEGLLVQLLSQRDQWAPYVLLLQSRFKQVQDYLIDNMGELIEESLTNLSQQFDEIAVKLLPILRFAASNQPAADPDWQNIEHLTEIPSAEPIHLITWQKLTSLFITKSGGWRSRLDKNMGFPPGDPKDKEFSALCKLRKEQFREIIDYFKDSDEMLEQLNYLRMLPTQDVDSSRWKFLGAVTRVLIHLNSELLLSFSSFGVMDYSQAGAAARTALGTEEQPTDLAMTLDHSIQHILVDEFQDTSQLQLEILQMLTLGWDAGDARSLFLVGDAMQSCYGFRNANVGIYLNVQSQGIGQIPLETLILRSNFRSQELVVTWVNKIFQGAFPSAANVSRGAVPYSLSSATHGSDLDYEIETQLINHTDSQKAQAKTEEAGIVVSKIRSIRELDPLSSIAILVRYRSHLAEIIPALQAANITWEATDIDRLGSLPIIEDLLSLTKALSNEADSLSWYALLRSPFCGLTSHDLHAVSQNTTDQSVWSSIEEIITSQNNLLSELSEDSYLRLVPFAKVVSYALSAHQHVPFRQLIESTWTLLRGYELAENEVQLSSAARYFDLISQYEQSFTISNLVKFEEQVKLAFVNTNNGNNSANAVQVLTMHKSKGLEYDHVILPGLSRDKARDDKRLLQWYERINDSGESKLFLSTQTATGEDEDKLYRLIQFEQQQKSLFEDTRLLYIAITRAKKSALLLATVAGLDKEEIIPPKNSLLARIWPQLKAHNAITTITELADDSAETSTESDFPQCPSITPLKQFTYPLEVPSVESAFIEKFGEEISSKTETNDISDFEDGKAALIGTLIHRSLELYLKLNCPSLYSQSLLRQKKYWQLRLREIIDSEAEIESACDYIQQIVEKTLANDELSWIFQADAIDSKAELSLTTPLQKQAVIDRTFIDSEGNRWIIDFKTSGPKTEQSAADFKLLMKTRYAGQLLNYARLFEKIEDRPIKLGLLLTHIGEVQLINIESSN